MPDIIQLLPDHVANQIAAGEVVQRPASVVKELLENAIDAESASIKLVVKDAGKTMIQVIDDGKGMSNTDARMSFERHATSKIRNADDLFNLHTKGFRGEALASIAAIAHVSLKTKTQEQDLGTEITIEGSKVTAQDVVVAPTGTTLTVKNLFYNIPARRNFLKSNTVELRHIMDEFHRVALAHPKIAFSMLHNGNSVFNLPSSNLKQRIVNTFGSKTNEKLVPVSEETDIVEVNGFVMKPQFAKKSRGEQFFFVNHRFVKSPYLHHAISSAFVGLVKDGAHPGYFLFLEVDPKSIDINIHPTKTEIKFDNEHDIYAMLRATIKHSLGQFSIAPILDFKKDSELDTPYAYHQKQAVSPTIEVDSDFNPFKENSSFRSSSFSTKKETNSWEAMYVGLKTETLTEDIENHIQFESDEVTGSLFKDATIEKGNQTFQIQNKYILSPVKSGLMVIHQHLAHQRILYEELLKNITIKEGVSQQLLFPIKLDFSSADIAIIHNIKESLENTGFVFSEIKEDSFEISGVPVVLQENAISEMFEQLIADLKSEVPDAGFSQSDVLAKSMSKNLAIKTGKTLTKQEQEHLIHQLFACKEPTVSPNNKTTLITIDVTTLDKNFI